MAESEEELRSLLWKLKEESEKVGLKLKKVYDIAKEAVIKTIPKKKKCKKAKWLSEKALQRAEKRREAKANGEKQRYTHLNAVQKNN